MFLDEIALVLTGEVVAPVAGELELTPILHGLLKDIDAFGVGQTDEICLNCGLKAVNKGLVDHLVEELEVVLTFVECPTHTIFNKVLLEVHELFLIEESHFGLHHPELSEVSRCVTVLGTEGGAKGIDGSQCRSTELSFQLSADRERRLFSEEVIVVDNLPVFVLLEVVEVLGRYLEHVSCSFTVAGSYERCVEIEESMLMEIGMDSHSHVVTNAHNGPKGVGA